MSATLLEPTPARDVLAPGDEPAVTARPAPSVGPPHPWIGVRVGCCALCPEAAPVVPRSGRSPVGPVRVSVSR